MTLQITKTDTLYGEYYVDAYTIPTFRRSVFAPIPEVYQGMDASVSTGTRISRYFTLANFTGAKRTRTGINETSATTPDIAFANMQRLCFEALDPATDYVGMKPTIVSGLASHEVGNPDDYNPSIRSTKIVGDSIFEALARGEGVGIQFSEDNEKRLTLFALYIRASCIYDRCVLAYSEGRSEPTLFITVNDKGRRLCYTTVDQAIVSKGIRVNG